MRQVSKAQQPDAGFGVRCRAGFSVAALLWFTLPATAQDNGFHPLDSTLKMLNLKTDAGSMPDFVQQTRPTTEDGYMPVGAKHPSSPLKTKTPDQIKAAEAELDAAHAAQLSGKRPKVTSGNPPKVAGKQSKNRPKVATDR